MRSTYPKYVELEKPLLKAISVRGGAIYFSITGDDLENELAEHFQLSDELRRFTSKKINAKGGRKWRNMIQFARRRLVRFGCLDNSIYDKWCITSQGYKHLNDGSL